MIYRVYEPLKGPHVVYASDGVVVSTPEALRQFRQKTVPQLLYFCAEREFLVTVALGLDFNLPETQLFLRKP